MMAKHKVKINPTITLKFEMVVEAETKNQAITKAEAYVIKQMCKVFGADHETCKIKFE